MRGIGRVDSQKLFSKGGSVIARGHRFKVKGVKFKGDVQGKFFTEWWVPGTHYQRRWWWKQAH